MSNKTVRTSVFFTVPQQDLMVQILNRVIPAKDGFPAAGDLGVVEYIDSIVGTSTMIKRRFSEGLTRIELDSQAEWATGFANLPDFSKDKVLHRVECDLPEFFAFLIKQTYNGYYTNSAVLELLGPHMGAPQPLGHDVEPGNLESLEQVKARGAVYRKV